MASKNNSQDKCCGSSVPSTVHWRSLISPRHRRTADEDVKNEYLNDVRRLREYESPTRGINRFPWQSRIVVEELFQLAIEKHHDVSSYLSMPIDEFYGHKVLDCYLNVIKNNNLVTLIFAEGLEGDRLERWEKAIKDSEGRLSVFTMKDYNPEYPHFCLVGDYAYRIEAPHPKWEPSKERITDYTPERPAKFCFNDPQFGQLLSKYTDVLKSIGRPIFTSDD